MGRLRSRRHRLVMAGKRTPQIETRRYLDRNGSVHVVENTSIPVTWQGKPAAIVLISDVTQARLTETLLRIQRDIGVFLGTAGGLAGAMAGVLERLLEIPGVDCGGIYVVDEASGTLRLAAHRGLSEAFVSRVAVFEAGTPEAGEMGGGKTFTVNRTQVDEDPDLDYMRSEGLRSLVAAPVLHEGAVVASINIASHAEDAISAHVIGMAEDIAERLGSAIRRIRNQELLAASEKKYRTLTENAKEGIVVIQDGVIKYVNPNAVRMSGYTAAELVGRPFQELIYPEDLDRVAARYAREMEGEDLLEPHIYRVLWKDGSLRWAEGIGISIEWEGRRGSSRTRSWRVSKSSGASLRPRGTSCISRSWTERSWTTTARGRNSSATPTRRSPA